MLHEKKLIIFDCDGVLFNSTEANIEYFNHCLEIAQYPPLTDELKYKVTFMSVAQLIHELIPDPAEIERVYKISKNVDYTPFIPKLIPLFDFDNVFTKLKKEYYLAVASNRGKSLTTLFKHFNLFDYFHYKISTIEAASKPDPDMLYKCINYFDLKPKESMFLGDSLSDYQAAMNAGIDFLWVGENKEKPNIISVEDLLHFSD